MKEWETKIIENLDKKEKESYDLKENTINNRIINGVGEKAIYGDTKKQH